MGGCGAGGAEQLFGHKLGRPGEETSSKNKKAGMGPGSRRSQDQPKVPVTGLCSFKSNAKSLWLLRLLAHRCRWSSRTYQLLEPTS